ncbi:hypothetical protein GOV10_05990 [Candidatus Woesearchaeota archaeon]|nr:hypothetical protein [Candidatus Woesearchaeota archaeon]
MSLSKKILGLATAGVMAFGLAGTAKTSTAQEHRVTDPPSYKHAPIVPGQNARDTKIFTEFEGIDTVIDSMYNYEYEDDYFRSPRLPWDDDVHTRMLWLPPKGNGELGDPLTTDGYLIQIIDFQGKNDLYDAKGAVALIDGPVLNEIGEVVKPSPDGVIDYVIRIEEKGWYNTQEARIMNHLEKGEYHTFNLTKNVINQEGLNISRVMQHNYRAALTTLLAWAENGANVNKQGRIEIDVNVYPRYFDYYFGPNNWCNPYHNYGFHCTTFWGRWMVPPPRWCPPVYRVPRWRIMPPRHKPKPKPPRVRRPSQRRVPEKPDRRDNISRMIPSTTIDDNLQVRRTRPLKPGVNIRYVPHERSEPRRTSPSARPSVRPSGQYTPRTRSDPRTKPIIIPRPDYRSSTSTTRRTAPPTYKPRTTTPPNRTYKPNTPRSTTRVSPRTRPSTTTRTTPRSTTTRRSSPSKPTVRSTTRSAPTRSTTRATPRSSSSKSSSSKSTATRRTNPKKK